MTVVDTSRVIGAEDRILCHCTDDAHEPGDAGCAPVKPGRYGRDPLPGIGAFGRPTGVTGTCRSCRRRLKVVRIETRGLPAAALARRKGETDLEFIVRRQQLKAELKKNPRGPLLHVALGVAPHKVKGAPCPGVGEPPAETRFTPGTESSLAAWVEVYGPDSVQVR